MVDSSRRETHTHTHTHTHDDDDVMLIPCSTTHTLFHMYYPARTSYFHTRNNQRQPCGRAAKFDSAYAAPLCSTPSPPTTTCNLIYFTSRPHFTRQNFEDESTVIGDMSRGGDLRKNKTRTIVFIIGFSMLKCVLYTHVFAVSRVVPLCKPGSDSSRRGGSVSLSYSA